MAAPDDLELLALDGAFTEGKAPIACEGWLRLPKGAGAAATAGPDGVTFWVKRGHLAEPPRPPAT